MASRAARSAQLRELQELRKSGKTRFSTYQVEEGTELYDELDDEGYKKLVRRRLDEDDFVVDDNGAGYVDDGREDWHNEGQPVYETESEDELRTRNRSSKRKREEEDEKQAKISHGINKYFNTQHVKTAPKPTRVATIEDAAFISDLLGEVDSNVVSHGPLASTRAIRSESRRKTRVLSPPVEEVKSLSAFGQRTHSAVSLMKTPPTVDPCEDDGDCPAPQIDDGVLMDDQPIPSSPFNRAVERKMLRTIKEEADEDDFMEVAEVKGHSGAAQVNINKSGARPTIKPPKTDYPTPASSSPTRPPPEAIDPSSWTSVTSKLNVLSSPHSDAPAAGKLRPEDALEQDGSLHVFWIDYTEVNGSLCLFGKVKNKRNGQYLSCFIKIDNILRKLYFLPRQHRQKHGRDTTEEVGMSDVYQEVDALMSRNKVGMHKVKPCTRKYAFELPDVPREGDYLKLLYPYDKPTLSPELKGETFSHVFGANTALFEQFVLWKNIMGPCWLKIEGADFSAVTNASWCKLELAVNKPELITQLGESDNLEVPPLTLMSIALRTSMNVKENKQEIIVASARIYENVSLTDTTPAQQLPCKTLTVMRPVNDVFPTGFKMDAEGHKGAIKLEKNEIGLLSTFMAHLQRFDPDVFVGHRLEDSDYSILLSRMRERKTPGWHRIGRLKRSDWPKNVGKGGNSFFAERALVAGRLMCDLANDLGKSLMTKCQSWSLDEMCELVLGEGNKRRDFDNEQALRTWAASRQGLMSYVQHCEADTYYIAAIALRVQMLPLTKVLTNLAGNSWARTLSGTRAERNEYILLHEFYRNKYICPDKFWGKAKQKDEEETVEGAENLDTKKKDKYKGGLVFEPEKGLYDKFILVMDFNSLYPSIIQEYNICFTTVDRSGFSEDEDKVPEVPIDQDRGILPKLISTLVSRRREVKKLMKDKNATSEQLATWDIKQLALKLTANSMYGCLGYTKSRFYARPLAMLTTFKGREILRNTKELAESTALRVIYGDTDSVMINTNMDNIADALKVGNEFKRSVNERYRLLEIDIDNIFRRLLLHAKKKYAAINMIEVDGKYVDKLEVKGLDMRRREYCALSKETSSKLLGFLLSGEEPELVVENIHAYLRELAQKMRDFAIPAQKYTIFTQLGKDPKEYPNAGSMPSVQVALRLMAKGKTVRAKDVMSFIITGNSSGSAENAAKNAYTLEDVMNPELGLKPDIDYYLHKQILPPVERLCAPISGTNVTMLADCLGLDTSKYRVSTTIQSRDNEVQPLESQIPDEIRFRDAVQLDLRCRCCGESAPFSGLAADVDRVSKNGILCSNVSCGQTLSILSIVTQLETQIRAQTSRYYDGYLVCDDPSCGARTRQMSVYGHRCLGPRGLGQGCLGRMSWETGERAIYNQLLYYQSLFDVEKAKARAKGDVTEKVKVLAEQNRERFGTCWGVVKGYLDRSGRKWVSMDSLFGFALKALA